MGEEEKKEHIPSQVARDELAGLLSRVQSVAAGKRLWERVLTDDEHARLESDFRTSFEELGTFGMWCKSRDVSGKVALIELGRVLGFLDEATAAWLMREMGEASISHACPSWNSAKGELRFEGRLVRTVRVMKQSNIKKILDEFESSRWPKRIKNPLKYGQQQLHEALASMNSGLQEIRFHSQEGGEIIMWDRV